MSLQESSMNFLFIRYLEYLTKEYPYIRLNMDDSSTTINLGYESYNEKKNISQQEFLAFEKYPIQVDLQKIETYFLESTICTITKATEMLLETKTKFKVSDSMHPSLLSLYSMHLDLYSNNELSNFLASQKRVVLELLPNDSSQGKGLNFIATVMLSTTAQYNSCRDFPFISSGQTKIGKQFATCAEQLWWSLPKEKKFDIFILRKDTKNNSTICEIINKEL